MTIKEYKFLNPSQINSFLERGFLRIPKAFSPEKAQAWTAQLWPRLGYDPNDKSTWIRERVNMPSHKQEHPSAFAPLAWGAICELLGGEDRVDADSAYWQDGFIVNLGTSECEKSKTAPQDLDNWHVDGDFFVHFLDSPEQGLLVIPIFSNISPRGGGTMVAPDGIGIIARHLMQHPEGCSPRMVPVGQDIVYQGLGWFIEKAQTECTDFHEIVGGVGDVVLLHPLMLHSASRNELRIPRVITNPKVSLKQPFCFDREDPSEYSLVERKTLKELGVERLRDWHITRQRERIIPERIRVHERMRELEKRRLQGENVGGTDHGGTVVHEELKMVGGILAAS